LWSWANVTNYVWSITTNIHGKCSSTVEVPQQYSGDHGGDRSICLPFFKRQPQYPSACERSQEASPFLWLAGLLQANLQTHPALEEIPSFQVFSMQFLFIVWIWRLFFRKQNDSLFLFSTNLNSMLTSDLILFLAHLSTKCSVSYCDPSMSGVRRPSVRACVRPSVNNFFKQHLLWNRSLDFDQTSQESSL